MSVKWQPNLSKTNLQQLLNQEFALQLEMERWNYFLTEKKMSQDLWKVQEYEDNNWINLPERLVTTLLGHEENKN